MAASAYLLELDDRRGRLLAEVIECLGVPSGSPEYEVALSFVASSLAHHDRMDAEEKKVETAICSFAEKVVVNGDPADATRLLFLASRLSGKPMRVEGHRMVSGDSSGNGGAQVRPPLEHPYAALAFMLALSGSQRWTTSAETTTAPEGGEQGEAGPAPRLDSEGKEEGSRLSSGEPLSGEAGQEGGGELFGFGGDSSRLWSTDSERDEEVGSKDDGEDSTGVSRPATVLGTDEEEKAEEEGTQDWLRAFEDDGERSPRTDDESNASYDSETDTYSAPWGKQTSTDNNGSVGVVPPPAPSSSSTAFIPATDVDKGHPGGPYLRPLAPAGRTPFPPSARHNYGAACIGANIRSIRGSRAGDPGGESAAPMPPFLRPCQMLEACQTQDGAAVWRRRRSVPEAEVVRAALHMLQGLSGEIFVRGDGSSHGDGAGGRDLDHRRLGANLGVGKMTGDGRPGGREAGPWNGPRSGTTGGTIKGVAWFSLSESAESNLAVASLSPEALAGVLGDLVRIGSTAEYLRAFVADAVASETGRTAAAATQSHGGNAPRGGSFRSYGSSSHERGSSGGETSGGGGGGGMGGSPKHGHTTQAFVACVRRQLESFEDDVARRDRWLYRRQQGRDSGPGDRSAAGGSGETIVGLLSLLQPQVESLELTRQLVEAGAGWWISTPPVEGDLRRRQRQRRSGGKGHVGGGGGDLRERTGRLLSVLHDALVSSALLGAGYGRRESSVDRDGGGGDCGAVAPRRQGWLLRVFCEVLDPYLRLVDAWITEGRLFDPHGELFFSRIDGDGGGGGRLFTGGSARSAHDKIDDMSADSRVQATINQDPVLHVWDTGVVLHSNALPPFLAALASPVALAGQDISLVRRVRGLLAGSSSFAPARGTGARLGRPSRARRLLPAGGSGTGLASSTTVLRNESFSLATTLAESLRRLAVRVRRANDAGLERKAEEGREDGARVLGREECRESPEAGVVSESPAGSDSIGFEEDAKRKDEDVKGGDGGTGEDRGESPSLAGVGAEAGVAPAVAAVRTPGAGTEAASEGDASDGRPTDGEQRPAAQRGAIDGDDGLGGVGMGDRRSSNSFGDVPTGGGGPAPQPAPATEGSLSDTDGGSDVGEAGGSIAAVAAAAANAKEDELTLGFFGGTAQLALEPDAIFQRALHPALAPPSLHSQPSARGAGGGTIARQKQRQTGSDLRAGARDWDEGSASIDGVVPRDDDREHGHDRDHDKEGAVEDEVARALPPTMVLETCLLGPLREHCRLASSSCLEVFADELGIVGLAGVLRALYLSPGGAKSDTPLSRFRGVLFDLLGALPPASRPSEGSPSAAGAGAGAAVLDGVVVRDVPSFLQDGSRLTALLQSSLAMSGAERGPGVGAAAFCTAPSAGRGGAGDSDGRESGEWLRSPVLGSELPLLEHFFVECRPEMVREWRTEGADRVKGGRDVDAGSGGTADAAAVVATAAAFPLARDGRCVDLQVFSCLQLECRLPWPISVALPPRSMDKYSRALGLLLKLEFTTHVLEEAHVLYSHSQRDRPTSEGELDRRHLQHCRLFAFLRVARAVRSYAVTQALIKPWAAFEARVPLCASLRGFIRLHEAYLDLILERCFLLPRTRQTLAYLLDALQAGIAFSQRYGEYLAQLQATAVGRPGSFSGKNPVTTGAAASAGAGYGDAARRDTGERERDEEACRGSLRKLDELWEDLSSALGFVTPLLKEMVRSRSGVHANELLVELDFNRFFERQEAWRAERKRRAR